MKTEYFDDCPVCQAKKIAEDEGRNLSLAELRAAFKAAGDQGAVAGGDWFGPDRRK